MDKVKKVEAVTPVAKVEPCEHSHWQVYQSLGYRICDNPKCKEKRPIFNVIKHQR
jgi:hypothetical protein